MFLTLTQSKKTNRNLFGGIVELYLATRKRGFQEEATYNIQEQTDMTTYRLNRPRSKFIEEEKIKENFVDKYIFFRH